MHLVDLKIVINVRIIMWASGKKSNSKICRICICGCPKQWHWGSNCDKQCTVCNCKLYVLHHEEARSARYNRKKLYVGIR